MNVNSDKPRTMPLNEALNYLQHHDNAILHYSNRTRNIDLWTPNSDKVPITLRRAVVKYSNDLEALLKAGDNRVCAARDLHAQFYRYTGNGFYVCEKCRELEPFMEGV